MGEFIRTERDGHLLIITLDRPQVLNALHAPACHELSAVWDDFVADDELWIAIVTGEGRAFCSGHDLLDGFDDPMPESGWAEMARRTNLNKPVICAVNGLAMGGGWEIALASDIVIADEKASFALSEPRVGYAALGGGAQRLVHRMPWHIAMDLLLTGRRMKAEEAHRWGVVTEVAPAGTVMERARAKAAEILQCSPMAVRVTKQMALASLQSEAEQAPLNDLSTRLARSIDALEDTKEGVRAFAEKRPPVWQGR